MAGKNLVAICSECKKIRIGDDTWIGKENPLYDILSRRLGLTDGLCPKCTDFYQKQVKQRRERINLLGY